MKRTINSALFKTILILQRGNINKCSAKIHIKLLLAYCFKLLLSLEMQSEIYKLETHDQKERNRIQKKKNAFVPQMHYIKHLKAFKIFS